MLSLESLSVQVEPWMRINHFPGKWGLVNFGRLLARIFVCVCVHVVDWEMLHTCDMDVQSASGPCIVRSMDQQGGREYILHFMV